MEYAVSREGTTLVTLHEGTDTTACDVATAQLGDRLETLSADERITDWSVADADVYEHPAAPFDPYTVTVAFTATVVVEADAPADAESIGAAAIDDALADAEVDAVSYTAEAAASAV